MSAPVSLSPSRLRAARVLRAHGVGGEVRAEALGGDAARFARGLRLYPEGERRPLTVRSAPQQRNCRRKRNPTMP